MGSILATICGFLLGILSAFRFDWIGQYGLNEILLAFVGVFALSFLVLQPEPIDRKLRTTLLLGVVFLFSLMFADLYRGSEPYNYLRGWARIVVTLVSVVTFFLLFKTGRHAWLAYMIGTSIAPFVSLLMYGAYSEIYKFYIGTPIAMFAFLICGYAPPKFRRFAQTVPLMTAILAFAGNSRSLAGITLIGLLVYIITGSEKSGETQSRGSGRFRNIWRFALVAFFSVAVFEGYKYVASAGILGEYSQDKYETQSALNDRGSFNLLSGRYETLFLYPKIMESPIIGYGSWPKDVQYVHSRAVELGLNPAAVGGMTSERDAGMIPTHSHVLGAWLEAGVLGAVFWGYIGWSTLVFILNGQLRKAGKMAPLMGFVLLGFCWDLIFSPYGAERRLGNGAIIASMLWLGAQATQQIVKSRDMGGRFSRTKIGINFCTRP